MEDFEKMTYEEIMSKKSEDIEKMSYDELQKYKKRFKEVVNDRQKLDDIIIVNKKGEIEYGEGN